MREIDLPNPSQDARGRDQKAQLPHRATVDERGGVTRDEDENLGSVAESIIANREPGQNIRRYMIDEDQPQCQPAEQIDPQFALSGNQKRNGRRRRGRRWCRIARDPISCARKPGCGNLIGNRHWLAPC
jgi:hypothetical protein